VPAGIAIGTGKGLCWWNLAIITTTSKAFAQGTLLAKGGLEGQFQARKSLEMTNFGNGEDSIDLGPKSKMHPHRSLHCFTALS